MEGVATVWKVWLCVRGEATVVEGVATCTVVEGVATCERRGYSVGGVGGGGADPLGNHLCFNLHQRLPSDVTSSGTTTR